MAGYFAMAFVVAVVLFLNDERRIVRGKETWFASLPYRPADAFLDCCFFGLFMFIFLPIAVLWFLLGPVVYRIRPLGKKAAVAAENKRVLETPVETLANQILEDENGRLQRILPG